ncbi:hypothetical protein DID88_009526 [Monilinia fructigena]|uniref:Uncharacterized protein n=1 Tax=Monilinia fructigena TaxID=38457 RepID=A0A395IM12_9HELO|nr:hypothetical protein DID88_009526 [Monilinia fructigena]
MQVPLIRLQCGVNSYDWGKAGSDSAAAKFAAATPADDFSIQEEKPYAELWMGTHPSNPSKDLTTKRTLLDLVQDNQASYPKIPLTEISHFLSTVPSLKKLVGESEVEEYQSAIKGQETSGNSDDEENNKKALQKAFTALMNAKKEDIEKASEELVKSAEEEGESFAGGGGPSNEGKELADLVGEAMFLKADDIHAYLSGDIIECMAASDNVVRAGFTPKFKDVDTLTSMLTYSYAPISEQKMEPVDYPYATLNATAYSSGFLGHTLRSTNRRATFEQIAGPSIFICTTGNGKISVGPKVEEVKPGYVYFVGATAEVVLEAEDENFTTFKAFCELQGKEDADGKEKL